MLFSRSISVETKFRRNKQDSGSPAPGSAICGRAVRDSRFCARLQRFLYRMHAEAHGKSVVEKRWRNLWWAPSVIHDVLSCSFYYSSQLMNRCNASTLLSPSSWSDVLLWSIKLTHTLVLALLKKNNYEIILIKLV